MTKYGVVCADPPWKFKCWSDKQTVHTRRAEKHYSTMTLEEIKNLPVSDLCADDCVLFLWVTDPCLPQAFEVIKAWNFEFKTVAFYWAKTNKKSGGFFTGLGWWSRGNCEQCLLATRGRPKRLDKAVKRLIVAPRREHSRKPDEAYTAMQRLVGGPYVELFARTTRPGWDTAFSDETAYFPDDYRTDHDLFGI